MFNLFFITTARMTIAMNDMVVQNMLLLTYNILPHKTCLKLGGMIHNKGAKKKIASTHGAPTLIDFYTHVKLNKDITIECPCESWHIR
jgi:hypothetical protein